MFCFVFFFFLCLCVCVPSFFFFCLNKTHSINTFIFFFFFFSTSTNHHSTFFCLFKIVFLFVLSLRTRELQTQMKNDSLLLVVCWLAITLDLLFPFSCSPPYFISPNRGTYKTHLYFSQYKKYNSSDFVAQKKIYPLKKKILIKQPDSFREHSPREET